MEFQSLSRRELQALCKSNKIPANMTNVAMADALAALSHVEGLEELGKNSCETPLRQTVSRTTTRRKPAIEQEPEGSIQSTRTRRAKSKAVSEKTDEEENNNINSLQTPAAPTTRRRAPVPSARTKLATEKVDKKAPAATGQSAYTSRRSTRLLEKTMAELTLTDTKIAKPNAIDEEAPKEVKMTEKDTVKPIKMDELHAEEDTPNGVSNEDEGNKDIEDKKSSVIPEMESKREEVDVPVLEEATKEETLDNGADENKDDTAATNVDDVVGNDVLITNVEGAKRDLGSEELLVEADDSSKPSHDKLVDERIVMKDQEVKSEEERNSLPDAEEVEEAADLEVMEDQTIVAPEFNNVVAAENANTEVESEEGEKVLLDAEEVEEAADQEVMDDETIVSPERNSIVATENANEEVESKESLADAQEVEEAADLEVMDDKTIVAPIVAAENANEEDGASTAATSLMKKMKEKESGKEEPLLQVYADPESVSANNSTTPAAASVQKTSSSKINQSALEDVNKENNVHESGIIVVESLAGTANTVEMAIQQKETAAKRLEDKSVRQLRKMLKEKLVISNKESGDEALAANLAPKKQVRQALQKLPENLQAIGEAE